MSSSTPPVFRFAPSPNGALHLGHAYSALLNQKLAQEAGGILLLRIEDIDITRCTPALESAMIEDLKWLGIEWAGSPRRQSDHFGDYAQALDRLRDSGLIYPAFLSRNDIRKVIADNPDWPRDPDGSPLYPGDERDWPEAERQTTIREKPQHAWRLDMAKAIMQAGESLNWQESGVGPDQETGEVTASPGSWGDAILARSDTPTSYHLSVVLDDALQGVTHIVRGQDLFHATSVHRLLQTLLGLPEPIYHHHNLVLADDGRKLSKSSGDTSLRALREAGRTPADIKEMIGFSDDQ